MKIAAVILEGCADAGQIARIREAIKSPETTVVLAPPRVADIIDAVARAMGVGRAEMLGDGRSVRAVRARRAVAWIARALGRGAAETARALGGRDPTTIGNLLRGADAMIGRDPAFAMVTARIVRQFEELNP
ncbi:MAG: helix-turn-helix domain-containing protein [Pseudomonadota bacterium]